MKKTHEDVTVQDFLHRRPQIAFGGPLGEASLDALSHQSSALLKELLGTWNLAPVHLLMPSYVV
jgi:hypothetical protein